MNLVEIFSYGFMQRALITGVMISACAALVGVPLVLRKNSMIGDGLSHAAFGSFAVAIALGLTPLWFAIPVVILSSFLTMRLSAKYSDSAVALLSAISLAIGTIAISVSSGANIDLNGYLFGSILSVGWNDMCLSIGLFVIVAIIYSVLYNKIFAVSFDENFARSIGIKTNIYNMVFSIICSVVVVVGMRLLGALLISSLIIFPTVIAMNINKSFKGVIISSVIISVINFILGLILSYVATLPTGATVVMVNFLVMIVVMVGKKVLSKR